MTARDSRSRQQPLLALLMVLLTTTALAPVPVAAADGETVRSFLEITPGNLTELEALVSTLEAADILSSNVTSEPVVVILHGDEALPFTRSRYAENRSLVDRTALLDAYRLLDVRMCRTWMQENGISDNDLLPFVDTVDFAPEEARRLTAEGYQPYGSVNL